MAAETESREYSTKLVTYKGGEDKWREWSIKTNAYASTRGWAGALTRDCEHADINPTALSEEQTAERVLNQKAWNHLVMVCQDSAFTVLTTATMSNAFEGWTALLDEYHKNDVDSLVDIESDFATCKLHSESEDPSLWIGRLKIINERLAKIGPNYKKNEYNLISHIFANLPQKMYMDVITTMQVMGLQQYDLKKVSTELKEKWKRDIKTGDAGKDTESKALNVNDSRKPYGNKKKWNSKQFKGTCRTCGKYGHKSADCRSKDGGSKPPGGGDKPKDFSDKKCYRCNKMGHLAWQCPDKDKETGLVVFSVTDEQQEPTKSFVKAGKMTKTAVIAASKRLTFDEIDDVEGFFVDRLRQSMEDERRDKNLPDETGKLLIQGVIESRKQDPHMEEAMRWGPA
jgi:hypothetical protein